MKYLIVGLGNIGPEYAFTRHNIGFMILDRLAAGFEVKFEMKRFAYHVEIRHKGKIIHLLKPTTYMNLSGKAVNHWMKDLKIEKENLLVICDDLALPHARIRVKPKGSHGGQNGLRNIEEILGTQDYARLRFGIGSLFLRGRQAEYVLSNFDDEQMTHLPEDLDRAGDAIMSFCLEGIQIAMNKFNQ
jgi:peptidyl-tRNA hydrolase, PTH1 family